MRGPNGGTYTGNVIYLSTFSKLLAPGIRLAWVIAPPQVTRKLVMAKQAADLHTATFNQMVAYQVGRERRDMMLETMEEVFPSEARWTHPEGGMFLWGIMPDGMDATEVLKVAIERKVAFVPGFAFHPNGGGENTMRLNFSYCQPDVIREGITRLGLTLKEMLSKNGNGH